MTGWRGVVRENYTGEIKGCQALCGGCFGLSGSGSIYWVGTTQQQREESQAECPQMTTTELPESCLYRSRESCVGGVCQTHQVDSTQWRPACEAASHRQRRRFIQGSIFGSHGWERTRNWRDGAWGSSRCVAIFAEQS